MGTELLRFNGAVERDPAIDAWMKEHAGGMGAIAHQWFEVMRKCGDEVREVLHDGCPVACLGDAPFGYVNVFTSHVNVGFFHGAALRDPARLLQGTGKFMRHVKLRPGTATNAAELSSMLQMPPSPRPGTQSSLRRLLSPQRGSGRLQFRNNHRVTDECRAVRGITQGARAP
jgi:hypothetical protein